MIFNTKLARSKTADIYQSLTQVLLQAGIELSITRKRVKNINFRLKPYKLSVSAPHYASDSDIITALSQRIDWAISQHEVLLKRKQLHEKMGSADSAQEAKGQPKPVMLWGEKQDVIMSEAQRIHWYRRELQRAMPALFEIWQPIVGVQANETRIKKMTTRWGSCNTRAKRVWLSVYLPAYPIECTEYVIVHELCHLHHANHSPAFWAEVQRSMPDYKRWHDQLAGKSGSVD